MLGDSTIDTKYSIVLRTRFLEEGAQDGPYRDIHYKILPEGSSSLGMYGIVGFPVLDCPPYGLGHRCCDTVHACHALGVCLPRLELNARNRYMAAMAKSRRETLQKAGVTMDDERIQCLLAAEEPEDC